MLNLFSFWIKLLFSPHLIISFIYWISYLVLTNNDIDISEQSVLNFSELLCSTTAAYFRPHLVFQLFTWEHDDSFNVSAKNKTKQLFNVFSPFWSW